MEKSFKSGEVPLDWKTTIIHPIFKKDDTFDASNYRPVSLTSLVVKVIESIIYDHMMAFLVTSSVQSNLLCCVSDWTKDADSERLLDIVYLDFSKAFDRVSKGRLTHKLDHLGLRRNLHRLTDSFLSDRPFRMK